MFEVKFTEGERFSSIDGCVYAPIGGDCKKVATISTMDIFASEEERANSSLIAAAPEMYDMLQSIENDSNQVPPFLWDKIQSVLAKARGEHV